MQESKEFNYHLERKLETLGSKRDSEILSEYRITDTPTFTKTYNINMNKDGSIFDNDLQMRYDILSDWIKSAKGAKNEII